MSLDQYPNLKKWYLAAMRQNQARGSASLSFGDDTPRRQVESAQSAPEALLTALCKSLDSQDPEQAVFIWTKGLDAFVSASPEPLADFLAVDEMAISDGLAMTDYTAQIAENSLRLGIGPSTVATLSMVADYIPLTAFRFLSAWMLLNLDDKAGCIDECDKITDPHGSVYALLGQAYLELGDVGSAVDALKVAVELDAREPMTWFFLAKAHLLLNAQKEAWASLICCEQLAGQSRETCALRVFIALNPPKNEVFLQGAWDCALEVFQSESIPSSLIVLLLNLALERNDESGFVQLLDRCNPKEVLNEPDFNGGARAILRRLVDEHRHNALNRLSEFMLVGIGQKPSAQPDKAAS